MERDMDLGSIFGMWIANFPPAYVFETFVKDQIVGCTWSCRTTVLKILKQQEGGMEKSRDQWMNKIKILETENLTIQKKKKFWS